MAHFDLSIKLDFLLNSKLQQIVLQAYQLTFEFDNDIRIVVEYEWELLIKDLLIGRGNPQRQSGPITELQKLIGAEIIDVVPQQDGVLTVTFSNKCTLVLRPCNEYEAYNISGKGIYIVV